MSASTWNWRASLLSIVLLLVFLGVWHVATLPGAGQQSVDPEYAKLVGAEAASGQKSALPGPAEVGGRLWQHVINPFYDNGPNDKGIGIQLAYSLARVLTGYLRNDSVRRVRVTLPDVRVLARDGAVVKASPVCLNTFG